VGLTQGFISGDSKGSITTLGREGSDYSASILACCLDADSLTVWKDVPGIMNGDPKRIENTIKYDELSYKEASEMTYYGAKVIHQDTIKPLSDQNITMYVRSFSSPTIPGTKIHRCEIHHQIPCIIYKENQCLISFRFNDYTYINEQNLVTIYDLVDKLMIRVNMMQNSAISISICIDYNEKKVLDIIAKLKHNFEIHYNNDLTMMTIKNYNNKAIHDYSPTSDVLLEQKTRADIQLVYRQE